jgi:23S rRNA pseudouridine1911/1915/1917 synthase
MSAPRIAEARLSDPGLAGIRLDAFVADHLRLFSRSQAKSRIVEASVNGKPVRLSRRLKLGDDIAVTWVDPPPLALAAEDIALQVLFENEDAIVIDKPAGMVVHPGSGNRSGTLVNAVLHHCQGIGGAFGGGDPRPGIVHRLDKDTSGVIVVAKNPRAHEMLAEQFRARSVRKRYVAVLRGTLPAPSGRIETRLARDPRDRKRFACVLAGGRPALTFYKVLKEYDGYSLASLRPRTGRTHQLRVHMRHLNAAILGDPLYGRPDPRFPGATLMLHARSLTIRLPGESEPRVFTAPLPPHFHAILKQLQSLSPR